MGRAKEGGEAVKEAVQIPSNAVPCLNLVGDQWVEGSGSPTEVLSPLNGAVIGTLRASTGDDVEGALRLATAAAGPWGRTPLKERCQIMFRLRELLHRDLEATAHTVSAECGKTLAESRGGILKGIEVLEFALSLQNLDLGGRMEVSSGVHCEYRREPLGVVAGITPFNFPAMVPLWMLPVAITLGNAFIWKPSDKTPLTSGLLGAACLEAGLPPGVLTILQGGPDTVEGILDADDVAAVAFVGSTAVARSVFTRGTANHKRVLALGGAKNHIILMPDAQRDVAVEGIVSSFTGCAGQRCMAASVLLAVGDTQEVIEGVVRRATAMATGSAMGAVITGESLARLERALDTAEEEGAKLLLDGRGGASPAGLEGGYWLGPSIVDGASAGSHAATEELFGPILTIIRCENLSEALEIERSSVYGNAASVFTTSGLVADRVACEASAGMVGVNIGVPVPREPFSFGGINASKFGQGDITGHGSLDFWSDRKKITSKWVSERAQNWMS